MKFVSIDVETANPNMASICQVGLAFYDGGRLIGEWASYLDPEDYFDAMNIAVHGIDERKISGAPTFDQILPRLYDYMDDTVVVSHTHFDRVSVSQATAKYNMRSPSCSWLDSAKVARRAWPEFSRSGYGLRNVCAKLGYEFTHHDALEDAKAAGFVILAASKENGLDLDGLIRRVRQPIDLTNHRSGYAYGERIAKDGNPLGSLHGEVLVFTGSLNIPRAEAADMAARVGCQVAPGVTKKTTLLVVGDQDVSKLAGHEKSGKHRKAEALIAEGIPMRILRESDFLELVRLDDLDRWTAFEFKNSDSLAGF